MKSLKLYAFDHNFVVKKRKIWNYRRKSGWKIGNKAEKLTNLRIYLEKIAYNFGF